MYRKMTDFLYSKSFIFIIAFAISGLCFYFAKFDIQAAEGEILNSYPRTELINDVKITFREDEYFKYIDVMKQRGGVERLKVDIKNGMIDIFSEFNNEKKLERDNYISYERYASNIRKSLMIPDGVDEKKAEILRNEKRKDELVTIKFPKIIISS